MKLAFSALALALVLGSGSAALAAHHKNPSDAAKASDQTDPRMAYKFQGSNHESWCDVSEDCNGWSKWRAEVRDGKMKIEPLIK
jgi:hypothetical protein